MKKISLNINKNSKITNKILKENIYNIDEENNSIINFIVETNNNIKESLNISHPDLKTKNKTIVGAINELFFISGIFMDIKKSVFKYEGFIDINSNYINETLSNPEYFKEYLPSSADFDYKRYKGVITINDENGNPAEINTNITNEQNFLLNVDYDGYPVWPIEEKNKGSKLLIKLRDVPENPTNDIISEWIYYWGLGDPEGMGDIYILSNSPFETTGEQLRYNFFTHNEVKNKIPNKIIKEKYDGLLLNIEAFQVYDESKGTWEGAYPMDTVILKVAPWGKFKMRWIFHYGNEKVNKKNKSQYFNHKFWEWGTKEYDSEIRVWEFTVYQRFYSKFCESLNNFSSCITA